MKLHGVRIEPEEIEAALESHEAIAEAAVVLQTDPAHLVAFYVLAGEPQPTRTRSPSPAAGEGTGERATAEASQTSGLENFEPEISRRDLPPTDLRTFLRTRLPEAMVPTTFVELAALPRNANGKLDRRALAALAPAAPMQSPPALGAAPVTPIEEVLAAIWGEVLGLGAGSPIARDANFFDLSGNSLTATQVGHRIREVFGVDLPLRRLFERANLAELAREIEAAAKGGAGGAPELAKAIEPAPHDGPLPATFIQEWAWYLVGGPIDAKLNLPLAVRFAGRFESAVMAAALAELCRRHESLRTRFLEIDGRLCQLFDAPVAAGLPEIDLSGLPEQSREDAFFDAGRREAIRPFHLIDGPLFRAVHVRLEGASHGLLLNIHHSISDGWSLEILKREIAILYRAFAAGEASPLPPLPVQYGDFAWWQREVFAESDLATQLAYWRERLADLPPVLDLPTDRPRPAKIGPRAIRSSFAVAPEIFGGIRGLARQEGVTLSVVLTAAVDALLRRYTGREDLFLNSIFSGRNRPELQGLIGLFMNTVVVRADLSGRPTVRELLRRVRDSVLEAYAHQDVPFMRVLADLFPGQKLERTLLSRVNLNLLSFPAAPGEAAPLPVETYSLNEEQVKVDLHLYFVESPESLVVQVLGAADLFELESLEHIAADLAELLQQMVADPGQTIDRLLPAIRHQVE